MDNEIFKYLHKERVYTNIGPNAKEILLQLAESEYNKGNMSASIFYQIQSLHQTSLERFNCNAQEEIRRERFNVNVLLREMDEYEKADFPTNSLLQYACAKLKGTTISKTTNSCNFLDGIVDPIKGVEKIQIICKELPAEWTILQLYKGSHFSTTYSTYQQIRGSDAPIYLTIVKHARSCDYPEPICLQVTNKDQRELYKKFACIPDRFKQQIKIDPNLWNNTEAKQKYWKDLDEINTSMADSIIDLKCFFFPWSFLFTGVPYLAHMASSDLSLLWRKIDKFCDQNEWKSVKLRVLLSLAALNAGCLNELHIDAIADYLVSNDVQQKTAIRDLLQKQQQQQQQEKSKRGKLYQHLPCILIVDERLDHFYWEELNLFQEFTRCNSLQSLWRLYNIYKKDIRQGYVNVHVTDGCCLLNPDNNLPKMELRMSSFFDYWLPHWKKLTGQKPTRDELFNVFLGRTCYVYSGHGSGLQYANGRHIAKQNMRCVVFLFGCDSSRLHSHGLYSELVGPHMYYHAAKCPAVVGTLLPGLDSNMDMVATDILSRWIAPQSMKVLPWDTIDTMLWQKEGLIKPSNNTKKSSPLPTVGTITPTYNRGSLCALLTRIHQRVVDTKLYNTVPYVCRGLPVWNCHVESLPLG